MNEKYTLNNQQDLIALVDKLSQKGFISFPVEVEIKKPQRTKRQNRSLYKYFSMLSQGLKAKDIDMLALFAAREVSVPVSETMAKEQIWRPIQIAMFDKESTADLETHEVAQVYDVVNRKMVEMFEVNVPWPCEDTLRMDSYEN